MFNCISRFQNTRLVSKIIPFFIMYLYVCKKEFYSCFTNSSIDEGLTYISSVILFMRIFSW